MTFPIKNESETLQEMMAEVVSQTGITNMNPGSIARTLLEVFNRRLNACYKSLDMYTSMSFLSTAQGMYLDMIGEMLACKRISQETDTNYRYRISQQVFTAAAANSTSVRLKCLTIPKVKNVVITPFSHGNGSFTVHVLTDEIDTPSDVLNQVDAVVREVKAEGIRAVVTKPTIVPVDVKLNITLRAGRNLSEQTLTMQIKSAIGDYIDSLQMGDTISFSEINRVAQLTESVAQTYINSISIDGKSALAGSSYRLNWDERAYINNVMVII